ncbi:aldehyde dehydrogenase family protein [Sporosarcina thermotolerans]|uniref:Aldehyde dehydrogenase family protein n=1 Tax=Sporosarcina thermotolerans TaxID=633404 RepID=A0AAW9A5C1_9BACL|nr:aldehyde dehydrogenase family protein [Sporosarcina thermotolerans]MDW0116212.1 aldehyde dehydrogenase family protein [Sporosarcina thermotolerans]
MKKKLYIGGNWVETSEYYELRSPYSQEVIAEVPLADKTHVEEAIRAASENVHVMRTMPAHERADILLRVATLLEENLEEAVRILVLENAKPIKAARAEIGRTVQTYRFASEEAKRLYGETIPMDAAIGSEEKFGFTVREPLGVIAAITPFNFPYNLAAHKLGPAIAAGNTIVLKPASQTPLSSLFIAELFEKAGLPKGVLNVITGSGAVIGDLLVTDERVKMVTFTGSLEVGQRIKKLAGLKRVTLELGSNSPVIIDKVQDLDRAVNKCVMGSFAYSGQVCISVQRIYVHEDIYDAFLEKFTQVAQTLKIGDPLNEGTDISALIHPNEITRIQEWIEEAESEGATKVLGGDLFNETILSPTILTNVPHHVSLCTLEAFAPVVFVNKFKDIDEAIKDANNSQYGLQAGIFTDSIQTALKAVKEIESGGINVNDVPTFRVDHMPYGGVKNSGTGKEGIKYSTEEMTEIKFISFSS